MRDLHELPGRLSVLSSVTSRRRFLSLAGGTAAMAAMGSLLAACDADDDDVTDDTAADDSEEATTDEPAESTDDADEPDEDDEAGEDEEDEESAEDVEPEAGGRLVVVATVEPETLNPYLTQLVVGFDILSLTMDSLLQSDDEGVYHPRLAESYEFSDDGLVCTMKLREDVDFHDGSHFTSEDLQATYDTIMDPDFGAFSQIGWSELEDFEVVDDYTVEMTLSGPYAPFISAIGETRSFPAASSKMATRVSVKSSAVRRGALAHTSSRNGRPVSRCAFLPTVITGAVHRTSKRSFIDSFQTRTRWSCRCRRVRLISLPMPVPSSTRSSNRWTTRT